MRHAFEEHHFAISRRDEKWRIDFNTAVRFSEHHEAGHALTTWDGAMLSIQASTNFDQDRSLVSSLSPRDMLERLNVSFEQFDIEGIRTLIGPEAAIELHSRSEVRIVVKGNLEATSRSTLLVVRLVGGDASRSVVTTPDHVERDLGLLLDVKPNIPHSGADVSRLPLLWKMGTGAVLLHELVGHASEYDVPRARLPGWLVVTDEPGRAGLITSSDDAGNKPVNAELSRGDKPQAYRRETFRDPPIRRMSNIVVLHKNAPFEIPDERIEIHSVERGAYDALHDDIVLTVSGSELVEGTRRRPLAAFQLRADRAAMIARIAGASGEPVRYPGVLCSREGQRVPVGSWSPDLLMLAGRS